MEMAKLFKPEKGKETTKTGMDIYMHVLNTGGISGLNPDIKSTRELYRYVDSAEFYATFEEIR